MKLLEKPIKVTYKNPIHQHYDTYTRHQHTQLNSIKYEKGMLISITNHKCHYESLYNTFKETYISIIKAIKGKDYEISKWDVRQLRGDMGRKSEDRILLPSREDTLRIVANETPIMIAGIHNYRREDIRSRGKEYCHSHFYIYNIHQHLPTDKIQLRDMEDKIERHIQRYTNVRKRTQGVIKLTEVGVGEYKYTEKVSPLLLYDYLKSPITNPSANNVINYIANNRHLPSIQYPLSTIYLNKPLC